MSISRRKALVALTATGLTAAAGAASSTGSATRSSSTGSGSAPCPDPIYEKPAAISEAEFGSRRIEGIHAAEVNDFSPFGYSGPFTPSPPHADLNPRKAILIRWKDHNQRFVFSHEASYTPWLELDGHAGLCNQFFESNHGAELFNQNGRNQRNSFVDIVESGPQRVWVRWNYICVHENDNEKPALRGTEDYVAYPNGLVWRRLTYETLRPDVPDGYSFQPLDFFCIASPKLGWDDLFSRDTEHGDYLVGSVIDAYSDRVYRKFWDDKGKSRRVGDARLLLEISKSKGLAMVAPFKVGSAFVILGESSGFPASRTQVVDHSFKDTGGWGWGAIRWDHWPVGWINSQAHDREPGSIYPYHFGQFSHYIVDQPIIDAKLDFLKTLQNMDLNRWTERHVYYTLTGVARDDASVRKIARRWLDKGKECANPASVADLI
ncbi:MAG TPA: hypothetical protein VN577_09290 [Terriglobales bacterium]|nr:hypothetical protein [Terriglobales bacterium]